MARSLTHRLNAALLEATTRTTNTQWFGPGELDAEVALMAACMPTKAHGPIIRWRYENNRFHEEVIAPAADELPPTNTCPKCRTYVETALSSVGAHEVGSTHIPFPAQPSCWGTHQ